MDVDKFKEAKVLSEKINDLIEYMARFGYFELKATDFCTELVKPLHDEYRRQGLEALNTELWRLQDEFAKL